MKGGPEQLVSVSPAKPSASLRRHDDTAQQDTSAHASGSDAKGIAKERWTLLDKRGVHVSVRKEQRANSWKGLSSMHRSV